VFTGIVQAVGRIVSAERSGDGVRLVLDAGPLDLSDIAQGDSIAVSGCCLTVLQRDASTLAFDVSAETLRCTAGLDGSRPVNLEKALRLSDRLGGHLVTGHVDGVGTVVRFAPVAADSLEAGSFRLEVDAPPNLARYIAAKGSIAVDGVSLTVNEVDGARFAVNLIPHTLAVTTLGGLAAGSRVNLEIDLIARYVARLARYTD
jgi:riboflavin synthase